MEYEYPLKADVEAFLAETSIPATVFGVRATKDRNFVRQLRNGRQCLPKTEARVRAAMAELRAEVAAEGEAA